MTYDEGIRWAVKHNTTSSGWNGTHYELPYWIVTMESKERALKFYDEELKYAKRKFPNQPDKLPELLSMRAVWTVEER